MRTSEPPEGLFYIPDFLSVEQEQHLLSYISIEAFRPYHYQGYLAKREIVFYGASGGYKGRDDENTPSIPEWIEPLRSRCANLLGLDSEELAMALVAHYPEGAGIGWHRDAPQFGPTVFGVSLASDADMRFRRFIGEQEEIFRIKLQQRSAYLISGPARSEWQHGMAPVKALRYSITFRTIRRRNRQIDDARHSPSNIAARLASLGLNADKTADFHQLQLPTMPCPSATLPTQLM